MPSETSTVGCFARDQVLRSVPKTWFCSVQIRTPTAPEELAQLAAVAEAERELYDRLKAELRTAAAALSLALLRGLLLLLRQGDVVRLAPPRVPHMLVVSSNLAELNCIACRHKLQQCGFVRPSRDCP